MGSLAGHGDDDIGRLTARQHQVLALMAQGRSNSSIARDLGISEKAVVRHTNRIYGGLDLAVRHDEHRRVLAVIRYLSQPRTFPADLPPGVAWAGQVSDAKATETKNRRLATIIDGLG